MNRKSDIIVVGCGLAGITAALNAAAAGKSVTLLCQGTGSLAIGSACIDVLGYVDGRRVSDPFSAMENLPAEHPYSIVGSQAVKSALEWFQKFCADMGMPLRKPDDGMGNHNLITVMGTFKPSYLCPESFATSDTLHTAENIAVFSVENMKDVHPKLIINQLRRYSSLKDRRFSGFMLPCPIENAHRNITPLDIARHVEKPEGEHWLREQLAAHAGSFDVFLLPPICGMEHSQTHWKNLCADLHVRIVEMISIPPAVSGLRLYLCLRKALSRAGIYLAENVQVTHAEVEEGRCLALYSGEAPQEQRWEAHEIIMATGGHLSGGISSEPGRAWESVFRIPLDVPQDVEAWSSPNVFGSSLFARMGVPVGRDLRPVDGNGKPILQNVRFAGRVLGGYDFALEKSGHGVALATGWLAGTLAGKE